MKRNSGKITRLGWIFRGVGLVVLLVAATALWKREEITRLLAVQNLFVEDRIVFNFSNMNAAFLTIPVQRGDGAVSPLPVGETAQLPAEVAPWIEARSVTAMVVLKDGNIVNEAYFQGTKSEDLRISWSMAKSYLSALFGIVLTEGKITSIDDPVTKYAPSLIDTAYDGATIRNVLNMASGVSFDEDYLDPNSDINRMGRVLALGGSMDDFTTEQDQTFTRPGQAWQYVSIDTHVISMVIRGATGSTIPDLMSEKVIKPMGLEREPYYLTDGYGVAFVLGGLNLITRDYARLGQMYLQNGRWNGQQIVPADWVAKSTRASAPTKPEKLSYGFQWWIPKNAIDGEFLAQGIYGQYIYINRPKNVVIAINSADRGFRGAGVSDRNIEIFRLIADSMQE